MQIVSIADRSNRTFPFSREIFEDRMVLYHGTWSTCSPSIESNGLLSGGVALDLAPFKEITDALKAVGRGSFFSGFHDGPYSKPFSSREVCFSTSFWGARAYATDGGGEVVRLTIQDANTFERICNVQEVRLGLIAEWESALGQCPSHAQTLDAIATLKNEHTMRELYTKVIRAKQRLLDPFEGGHAVVYAVRVEPSWFGDSWDRYLLNWTQDGHGREELSCEGERILAEQLVGRVDYPHGTDASFDPSHITTWVEVEEIND